MNKGKRIEKNYACCDESKGICEVCSFEDSIKIEEENEYEQQRSI